MSATRRTESSLGPIVKKNIVLLIGIVLLSFINIVQALPLTKNHADSLNYKELFQFKKETLIYEATTIKDYRLISFNQRWQARFLLATLSAILLGLSATSKGESKIILRKVSNQRFIKIASWLFLFLFFFYDCHIGHMWNSANERQTEINQLLNDLPTKSYHSLMTLVLFKSISKRRAKHKKCLAPNSKILAQLKWWLEKLSVGLRLDFFAFYSIVLLMWFMAIRILRTTATNNLETTQGPSPYF